MSSAVEPLGRCTAVYTDSDNVFKSGTQVCLPVLVLDSDYSEFFGFGRYFTGAVFNRFTWICNGYSDYYGTEYRYLCNGD